VEPIVRTVERIQQMFGEGDVILLSPQGVLLQQHLVEELAERQHWIVICGHYKGVDERIRTCVVDREISVGDYVVSGGELPAMVLIDAAVRLRPGVVGNPRTVHTDSHRAGLLDHPWYTRPEVFRGWEVPNVLLSGNHEAIAVWRRQERLLATLKKRPELLEVAQLTEWDRTFLRDHGWGEDHAPMRTRSVPSRK
jgi:tRNA (guanine37-N1)-methyltransferase